MAKYDLISVGTVGIDIILDIHSATNGVKLNKSSKELMLKSGGKILLDGYRFSSGQNGANVAVGVSRLGLKSTIYAEVGSDDFAKRIVEDLEKEKVDTSNIKVEKGDSSFSVIIDFQDERTIFAENIKRDHTFDFRNVSANFVYLTSLSRNWINAYLETLSFVTSKNIPFAFSPGTTQIEDKDKIVFDVIKKAQILFVNKEEAEMLLDRKKSFTEINEKNYIKKLLFEFKKIGAGNVVITDGENGSYCIDSREKTYYIHALSTQVLGKTGAGDAYATGFIYGFMKGVDAHLCMAYGSINASSVIERIGAQEGLLSSDILEDKAKHLESFKAVNF